MTIYHEIPKSMNNVMTSVALDKECNQNDRAILGHDRTILFKTFFHRLWCEHESFNTLGAIMS